MVVDLPAPLGPTKPVTWPGRTVNVIPSSACTGPNRLRSPSISIVAFIGRRSRSPGARRVCPRPYARRPMTPPGPAVTIAAISMTGGPEAPR
jgi:hypothetical protein